MATNPIIVVGHTALDRVYRIEAFPARPTKVRALDHREEGGGSAANAAAAIAVLGGAVRLWSRVGDDETGAKARRALERTGVDVSGVLVCAGAKTPTAGVIVDAKGERLVVSEDDHVLPMEASWLPLTEIASAGAVLSDLSWLEGTRAEERVADLTDAAIFSAPGFEKFVSGADDAARFAALHALGVQHAGVTRGANGYVWSGRDGTGKQGAFKVPVVDTTGAGDAFHGVFALALASGLTDAACARVAAAASSLKCRRLGARAGLPTAMELDAFLLEQTGEGLPEGFLADKPRLQASAESQ